MRPLHGDELRDDLCLLSGAEGSAMLCPGGGSPSSPPPPPGGGGGEGGRKRRRREERCALPPSAPRGRGTGGGGGGRESPPQQRPRLPRSQLGWPLRPTSHPYPPCSCGSGESRRDEGATEEAADGGGTTARSSNDIPSHTRRPPRCEEQEEEPPGVRAELRLPLTPPLTQQELALPPVTMRQNRGAHQWGRELGRGLAQQLSPTPSPSRLAPVSPGRPCCAATASLSVERRGFARLCCRHGRVLGCSARCMKLGQDEGSGGDREQRSNLRQN
ncbi:hypothetical protein GH733_002558 [Mirounga leonina]|nr:hypothetical protein GH733_002558 [Mirounga leonina]